MIKETAMKPGLRDDFVEKVPSMLRRLAAEYGPDSKLPSVRELSRRFGVSTMELDAALEELERDELVYRRGRVGIFVSTKIRNKNFHIVLNPQMMQNPGASPVWGQVCGTLLSTAERRATDGEAYTFHMSNTLEKPGPIRDLFLAELERGRVTAVLGVGLHYLLVQEINRFRVPVVSYAGAGNHVANGAMHEQVQTVTGMLVDAGCRRIEFWTRANTWLSPFAFSVYDVLDPVGMIARFRDPYDRAAQRIASRAPAETARRLAAFRDTDEPTFDIRHRLIDVVNVAQFLEGLWDERVFRDVELRPETVEAVANRHGGNTALMTANRMLIQDVFPTELVRTLNSDSDAINGFRVAMKRHFPGEEAVIRKAGRSEGDDLGNQLPGYNLARSVYSAPDARPDGLVIEDDMVASGVHKALEELGIRVGDDVKIATHANAGSAVGFALHGRVIQMLFDPTDFVNAMFNLVDDDSVNDLDRMTYVRVEPRILNAAR